jgi:hypothetical protein
MTNIPPRTPQAQPPNATEDLNRWVFFQRMKNLHAMELRELMDLLNELAPDASAETKTAIAWYMRHMRFVAQAHCHFLEEIYKRTNDPEIRSLAEISLGADDFRGHSLPSRIEEILETKYRRGWQQVKGCLPWKDCEHKPRTPGGHNDS